MSIFSRRDVQKALNSLADVLTETDLLRFADSLNQNTAKRISTEWETVIMAALSAEGTLRHEQPFGGTSRPDIFFAKAGIEFVADIRTVSDANIEDENPVEFFRAEILRVARRLKLSGAGLFLEVGRKEIGPYGDRKQKLLLPSKGNIPDFIRNRISPFLKEIAANAKVNRQWTCEEEGMCFTLRYTANQPFSGGSWISYDVPYSADHNPLFKALKAKADQLRKSGYSGLRGIIVCDGSCAALAERSSVGGAFGCKEIIKEFFAQHRKTVSFILVLSVVERNQVLSRTLAISIQPKLFWNPQHDPSPGPTVDSIFKRMLRLIPQPARTPANALHLLARKNPGVGDSFYGGFSMKGLDEIKISTRTLIELLAGTLDQQKFLEDHGFVPSKIRPSTIPFFKRQIINGRMLKSAHVEHCEHEDDDWIVLRFDGPDPAISQFQTPKSQQAKSIASTE